MKEFTLAQINQWVLKKQHLLNDSKINDILQITEDICGLHATGTMEPYLTLFARAPDFKKEDFENELYIKKTLGRIRGMRKTLFIHTKKMIPIIHSATKHLIEKLFEKYLNYRGISSEEYKKLSSEILNLLSQKEKSTSEIKKALNSQKDIGAIISIMCDEMAIIRTKPIKSWKDRRIRYASFKEYFPEININNYNEEEGLKILVKKYLNSYGPSTENDIVWWTGIIKSKIRKALDEFRDEITTIKISPLNHDFLILQTDLEKLNNLTLTEDDVVNFLPQLDPYLMGYKDRERYIEINNYEYVFDRSGNITSTILLDGRIIGVWDVMEKPDPIVKMLIFEKIDEIILDKAYKDAKRIGEFIMEKKVQIKECKQMIPLTKRTAGGFMTPLKDCS
ncbi:MAG: winged helix DNA-binding domain-containing protein [Candidatus Hodarchaeota archaeon]